MDIKVKWMTPVCVCVCVCVCVTISTAAGRCLCTGRLEQPERRRPGAAEWPCSPDRVGVKTSETGRHCNLSHSRIMSQTGFVGEAGRRSATNEVWLVISCGDLLELRLLPRTKQHFLAA